MPRQKVTAMQSESIYQVRLDTCNNCGLVMILWALLIAVGISAGLGAVAPTIYNSSGKSTALACRTYTCDPSFFGYLNRITKKNQMVFLELVLAKPHEHNVPDEEALKSEVDLTLEMVVTVKGEREEDKDSGPGCPSCKVLIEGEKYTRKVSCLKDEAKCEPVVLWAEPFLDYPGYHVQVMFIHPYETHGIVTKVNKEITDANGSLDEATIAMMHEQAIADERFIPQAVEGFFEMKYVNVKFTNFEYCVKYIFCTLTLVVAVWYHVNLNQIGRKYRSYEQNWISVLLIALFFFNDPFFGVEIGTAWSFWTGLYVFNEVTLACLLLLFFLSVFDIVGSPSYHAGDGRVLPWSFYLVKMLMVAPIWVFTVLIYMYVRLQDQSDPQFRGPMEMPHFRFSKSAFDVCLIVYAVYAAYLLLRLIYTSCGDNKPPQKYMYLFLITVLSFGFTIIGEAIGAFSPEIVEKEAFFFFVGTANSYIWILAFCYTPNLNDADRPAASAKATTRNPMAGKYQSQKDQGSSGDSSLQMSNMPKFPPQQQATPVAETTSLGEVPAQV